MLLRISVQQDQAVGELINGINKLVVEKQILIPQHTAQKRMVCKSSTDAVAENLKQLYNQHSVFGICNMGTGGLPDTYMLGARWCTTCVYVTNTM